MLLHIDTAVLRSAVSVAEQTNSSISDAASLLNQITVHEDWICKERDQIKQMTLANKQTAQDIENLSLIHICVCKCSRRDRRYKFR